MTKFIKHKINVLSVIVFGAFLVTTLFSSLASAAPAGYLCYTYDATAYTAVNCSVLLQAQPSFKPASTNPVTCYSMRQATPSDNTSAITKVDCTAAASNGGDLSNVLGPAVNLGDTQGKFSCGGGGKGSVVHTTIDFGCVGHGNGLLDLTFAIVRFLSAGVGIIIVGSLVFAGIQYTASRGDPSATAAAVKRVQNTLIALLIYIFSFAILNYIVPASLLR
jgi:hypothetical protein